MRGGRPTEWLLERPWRLLLLVSLALALPIVLVGETSIRQSQQRFDVGIHAETLEIAQVAADGVNLRVARLRQFTAVAADNPDVREAVGTRDLDRLDQIVYVTIRPFLGSRGGAGEVTRILVADSAGVVIQPKPVGQARRDPTQAPTVDGTAFFKAARAAGNKLAAATATTVSVSHVEELQGVERVFLSAPVTHALDPFVGALILEIRTSDLASSLNAAGARDVYLVDQRGRVIARASDATDRHPDLSGDPVVRDALAGRYGAGRGRDPLVGTQTMVGSAAVGDTGWVVVATREIGLADTELAVAHGQQRTGALGLAGVLLLGSVLIGRVGSRSIRRRDALAQALEQQTAAAEILRVIGRSPDDIEPVLNAVIRRAVDLTGADNGSVIRLEDGAWRHVAMAGDFLDKERYEQRNMWIALKPGRGTAVGRVLLEKRTVQIMDMRADPEYDPALRSTIEGVRTILGVPLLRDRGVSGVILLRRRTVAPFDPRQIKAIETFAAQADIAIENVRLLNETKEMLSQQTAVSQVLQQIGRSAFDLQAVLDTVLENAVRLCKAGNGFIVRYDGELFEITADHGFDVSPRRYTFPAGRNSIAGRVVLEAGVVQIADAWNDQELDADLRNYAKEGNFRTMLGVPLVRDERIIGVLSLRRNEVRLFSDREIQLVQTFADQAAIAIENVRLFGEIQEKGQQLEAASRHKSEFLANMSHELRTPLNAIIGFSEVLLAKMPGDLNAKQREYVEDIRGAGEHQLILINEVLDLSKVEAGRMELEIAQFDLGAAIDRALTLVKERAGREGVSISADVPADLGRVTGDERKLTQVLLNLLTNAVKFTPAGGWIGVVARKGDHEVQVSVRDTGIGIAAEDRERIFEEFRQVAQGPERPREGTGLGLALSKRFIELHGGRIWLDSEVGRGSTFAFTIPVTQRVEAQAVVADGSR